MTINEAIKQEYFKDNLQKSLVNILYTNNWLRDLQTPIFKAHQIQPQHFNVLRIIKGKHPAPVSPKEIIAVMLDKGRDLTRLVDKLEKLDLVHRQLCPSNRRKVEIRLTEVGIQLVDELSEEVNNLFESMRHLSEEEAETLSHLLDKLRSEVI